jgi:hypothetical protein
LPRSLVLPIEPPNPDQGLIVWAIPYLARPWIMRRNRSRLQVNRGTLTAPCWIRLTPPFNPAPVRWTMAAGQPGSRVRVGHPRYLLIVPAAVLVAALER